MRPYQQFLSEKGRDKMLILEIGTKYPSTAHTITHIAITLLVAEILLTILVVKEEIGICKEMNLLGKVNSLGTIK